MFPSKAHTKDAKKWLDLFEKNGHEIDDVKKMAGDNNVVSDDHFESNRPRDNDSSNVPVLVCMTFADRLLAEMLDEDGKYHEERTKKAIAKHFDVSLMTAILLRCLAKLQSYDYIL